MIKNKKSQSQQPTRYFLSLKLGRTKHHNKLWSIKPSLSNKRGQQVFGMSYSMIFSIILIVFFIAAAFIAIRFFLDFQTQTETGLFYEELQKEVDKAWESRTTTNKQVEISVPSGITYACLINMTALVDSGASIIEQEIYKGSRIGDHKNNVILWPREEAGALASKYLEHIKLPSDNPHCIPAQDRKIKIIIERNFEDALVSIR